MDPYGKEVVLITRCSAGGIGHALALAFAANNCLVVATSRSRSAMADLENDPRFFLKELDVSSEDSVQHALSNVLKKYDRVDVLVNINNAGVQCVAPLAEVPLPELQRTFDTNVYGPLRLVQAVVPHMASRKKGKGRKCGKCNCSGSDTMVWYLYYIQSCTACNDRHIEMELRPFGIDVINVDPGALRSNIGNAGVATHNRMPEWKLYKPFEAAIRARAHLSQGMRSTPLEEFAKKTGCCAEEESTSLVLLLPILRGYGSHAPSATR